MGVSHQVHGIECYKARLVAKGFHQRLSINYHDTFSLVIKLIIIHIILSLALSHGWLFCQLDVNNALLLSHFAKYVYMSQPLRFVDPNYPTHVYKLKKALYRLKHAPRS